MDTEIKTLLKEIEAELLHLISLQSKLIGLTEPPTEVPHYKECAGNCTCFKN